MRFLKLAISLVLGSILQSLASNSEAETSPPYYTKTTTYTQPDNYCLSQGTWNGDLSHATLQYLLTVSPTDHNKYGDIFLGFRRKSIPDKLWLYGFSILPSGIATKAEWVPYDQGQVPVAYSIGQSLPATTMIHILENPTDITSFQDDGEVFAGYGLRNNESSTTPQDSFNEMLAQKRFTSIWQVKNQQSATKFGHWICFKFNEITERIEGFEPAN